MVGLCRKHARNINPQDAEQEDTVDCNRSLLDAARHGDVAGCNRVFERHDFKGINMKDPNGSTVLHHAARQGLAQVTFAILCCNDFTDLAVALRVKAEALIDGVTWTATELNRPECHWKDELIALATQRGGDTHDAEGKCGALVLDAKGEILNIVETVGEACKSK